MIVLAIDYQGEVKQKMRRTWFQERYKYYHCSNWCDDWEVALSTWNGHQFVSVRDGEVIGYIGYKVDRANELVYDLNILNFEDKPSTTFSVDLGNVLKDIFEKFGFRKLNFSVVIGNPIESSYDKMCDRFGGRIVGIAKENVRLFDGKYHDEKYYEIFRRDYMRIVGKEVTP